MSLVLSEKDREFRCSKYRGLYFTRLWKYMKHVCGFILNNINNLFSFNNFKRKIINVTK